MTCHTKGCATQLVMGMAQNDRNMMKSKYCNDLINHAKCAKSPFSLYPSLEGDFELLPLSGLESADPNINIQYE